MKQFSRVMSMVLVFMLMFIFLLMPLSTPAYATSIEDNIGQSNSSDADDFIGSIKDQDIGDASNIGSILGGQQTMTSDHLQKANKWAAPITNFIGYAIGIIVTLIVVFTGLLTALDILYISIPPIRNLLYKAGTDGTGAYTGMGMGMGGGYGRGGMGASGGTAKPTQWVSDEAVACAAMLGGSRQAANMGGGMGMGMGGMGMGMQQPQEAPPVKSVIWVYLKKRSVFLVLLMIAIMVLTSSALLGTGVNLAQWLLKIIMVINGNLS